MNNSRHDYFSINDTSARTNLRKKRRIFLQSKAAPIVIDNVRRSRRMQNIFSFGNFHSPPGIGPPRRSATRF